MYQTPGVNVHTITSGETFGADEELLSKVRKRTQLTVTHWLESLFIIVFCPITSRVGSDVEAAMNKVPAGQNVILVLMHHTRDEGYSTAGTIWSDQYPNVILDVHVLFHETVPGLLQCAKNTEAVDQLIRELDQRSQNQQIRQIRPRERGQMRGPIERLNECCFQYWKFILPVAVVVMVIIFFFHFLVVVPQIQNKGCPDYCVLQ
ncbi:uncharacterized protein LOC107833975 [Poecilia formosa]|uniref:uncharacterized protein LOC107833975 n=1 Tax=Poecilia formosa TaxID=48698 RepID=UPI0007BA523F|nr:PREDICTED: uncharacterized protein LOC107833975 [Poecilia formosa]